LRQDNNTGGSKDSGKSSPDRINISDRAKRGVIVNKIAADIIEKITNFGPKENLEEVNQKPRRGIWCPARFDEERPKRSPFYEY